MRAVLGLALLLGCSRVRTPEAIPWTLPTLPQVAGQYSVRSDLVWSPRESLGVAPSALAWATRDDETLFALRAVDGHERETLFLLHIDGDGRTTIASAPTETDMRLLDVVATEDAYLVFVGDQLYHVHLDGRLRLEPLHPERARAGNPMECCMGDRGGLGPRVRASSSTRAQIELRQLPRPEVILEGPGGGWLLPVVAMPRDHWQQHPGLCLNVLGTDGGTASQWCDLDAPTVDEFQRHGSADARWFLCGPHASDVRAFYEGLGTTPVDWESYCANVVIRDPYVLPMTVPDALSDATWTVVEAFIRRHLYDPWNNLGTPLADVLTTASGTWVTWTEWLPEDRVVLRTARVASTGLPEPHLADLPISHSVVSLDAYDTRDGLLVVAHDESDDTTSFWPEAAVSERIPAVRVTVDEDGTAWACTRVPPARCGTLNPRGAELRPASHCGWPLRSPDALSVLVEFGSPVHSVALVDARTGEERVAARASRGVLATAQHGGFGWYVDGYDLWRVSGDAIEHVERLSDGTSVLRADTVGLRALGRDALLTDLRVQSEVHFVASFAGEGWSVDGPTSSQFWPGFGVVEQSLSGDLVSVRFTPSMSVARHMSVLTP